jgi:hypothetical protein
VFGAIVGGGGVIVAPEMTSANTYVSFAVRVKGGASDCAGNEIVSPLSVPGPRSTFQPALTLFKSSSAMYAVPAGGALLNENVKAGVDAIVTVLLTWMRIKSRAVRFEPPIALGVFAMLFACGTGTPAGSVLCSVTLAFVAALTAGSVTVAADPLLIAGRLTGVVPLVDNDEDVDEFGGSVGPINGVALPPPPQATSALAITTSSAAAL